jgi:uncharacterized protein YdhG (YjbR/CyaY superfamily)
MDKVIFANIDEYMKTLPEVQAMRLEELRQVIRQVAPQAVETISYNMPAFKVAGKILVYIAAFRDHISLFPANSTLIKHFEGLLKDYSTTKGTIHFDLDTPVPADLVRTLVSVRVKENLEKSSTKKQKK